MASCPLELAWLANASLYFLISASTQEKDLRVWEVTGVIEKRITQLAGGDWRTKGHREGVGNLEMFLWYGEKR